MRAGGRRGRLREEVPGDVHPCEYEDDTPGGLSDLRQFPCPCMPPGHHMIIKLGLCESLSFFPLVKWGSKLNSFQETQNHA